MAMEAEAQVKLAEAEKERAIEKAEAEKERALAEREAAIQLQAEALAKFNRQKKEADRQKKEAEERERKARGDKLLAEAKASAEAKMLKWKIEQLERELAKITKKEPGPGQADEDAADDDDDAVLASTPELLAASLAPAPAPPAEASVDPAVRRELADLAVGLASSQASRAAVERVASTGSANIPSLDRSVSELGMDDLDDIPEADEADYSFRFSQFSGDSQDKKKVD